MFGIPPLGYLMLSLSIGYVFVYSPWSEVSALNDSKDQYTQFMDTISQIETKKNDLQSQFNQISEEDKRDINTVLPNSLDYVKLVSEIDNVAKNYGIIIDKINLNNLDSSVGDSVANAEPSKPYRSAILGFSFVSDYKKAMSFIDELERSMRILDIRSMKIDQETEGGYIYSVQFETYWLK